MNPPLIVLIHGIRTRAPWQEWIKDIFEEDSNAIVETIGYGDFALSEFLLPGPTRRSAINQIRWRLDRAIELHPGRDLVILAHSFGTYCITEILKSDPQIRPIRVLLCGSVVLEDFNWHGLRQQPIVLNDRATKDIWPPLARSITWGYGASGTFGFKTPGIRERAHPIRHSDYFDPEFVRKYWLPFVVSGVVVSRNAEELKYPFWISLLARRILGFPWLGWAALFAAVFLWVHLIAPTIGHSGVGNETVNTVDERDVAEVRISAEEPTAFGPIPPTVDASGKRVFRGAAKVRFTISHDMKAKATIVVDRLGLIVTRHASGVDNRLAYVTSASDIKNLGQLEVRTFWANLSSGAVRTAGWINNPTGLCEHPTENLLSTVPPLVLTLVPLPKEDLEVFEGVIMAKDTGLYDTKFVLGGSVSGRRFQKEIVELSIYGQSIEP